MALIELLLGQPQVTDRYPRRLKDYMRAPFRRVQRQEGSQNARRIQKPRIRLRLKGSGSEIVHTDSAGPVRIGIPRALLR